MVKVRESNFELMRIISMFFIVVYHILLGTGGSLIAHTSGCLQIILRFISIICMVHVNSFILVSGYFQYDKKLRAKKIISMFLMVWFYKIVIGSIAYFFFYEKYTTLEIVKIFSPLDFDNLWFVKTYLALYILSPYINILIKNLTQKAHRNLIILLIVMFSLVATMSGQATFANTGFGLIHFVFLYIVGAYLHKYPIAENYHFSKFSAKKKFFIFLTIFFFMGTFNFLFNEFCLNIRNNTTNNFLAYVTNFITENMSYYQNPILLIQSISYFLLFETFTFKSKLINKVSSAIFAVYVITENNFIRLHMYKWLHIYTKNIITNKSILLYIPIWAIGIMLFCVVIELIRKFIINIFLMLKKKVYSN